MRKTASVLVACLILVFSATYQIESNAHGDEDHGAAPPPLPTLSTQGIAPRFSVSSDELELVGVYTPHRLTLYVDHFADNTPVSKAKLELEITGGAAGAGANSGTGAIVKANTKEIAPGVYILELPEMAAADYSLTISIEAGELVDLLAAKLSIPANTELDAHAFNSDYLHGRIWFFALGGCLMLIIVAGVFLRRRQVSLFKMGGNNHV